MTTRVCARKSAMIGTARIIAGGMTRKDQTPTPEFVVGPMMFNSGVEEMKARDNNASTIRGAEEASRMITEHKRSITDPARRAAAIPSVSATDQAINNATIVNTTVRNKGRQMRLNPGACKIREWPRLPRAASATQFR